MICILTLAWPAQYPPFFEEDLQLVDAALQQLIPAEETPPQSIHQAMRYSVFAGGKRIRPILCLETARIFAQDVTPALHPACAIEFIHTYSLIHDDLPALDNDDLRRGKPTCHKQFGEAIAILAGDALLTLAFETLGATPVNTELRVKMLTEVATSAGTMNGMVGGQVADLEAEGAGFASRPRIRCSALLGESTAAGFPPPESTAATQHPPIANLLQKTAGKDIAQQKATYPAVFGLERSHEIANELSSKAIADLASYGARAARLREIAEFLVHRRT